MTVSIVEIGNEWGVAVTKFLPPRSYKTTVHKVVGSREVAEKTAEYFRERLSWAGCLDEDRKESD